LGIWSAVGTPRGVSGYPVGWDIGITRDSCALQTEHYCNATFCIFPDESEA